VGLSIEVPFRKTEEIPSSHWILAFAKTPPFHDEFAIFR
jgi:hypothetical protein